MDTDKLAEAITKLAEAHDRFATAVGRIADQMTNTDGLEPSKPSTAAERLVMAINDLGTSIEDGLRELRPPDSD